MLAHRLAQRIFESTGGVSHVTVGLLSAIGRSIDEPQLSTVDVCAPEGLTESQRRLIRERVAHELNAVPVLIQQLIDGTVRTC
ncbi:hypothetical protein J8I87_40385 [Paraburkholderia sp. LEh10]|uniref:methionine adenosyltransferase n=1 Tax=Paraburkholderia sp. LEh10 TaxID=2821353 RepID=UPI001AE8C6D1|nr:hypothetical protein [Paraburkholderia sp. LEh10]